MLSEASRQGMRMRILDNVKRVHALPGAGTYKLDLTMAEMNELDRIVSAEKRELAAAIREDLKFLMSDGMI